MDYWPHLDLAVYEDWNAFLAANPEAHLLFFSTKGKTTYWDISYPEDSFLVFGSESHGLPPDFYERYRERLAVIPMEGKFHRSLNLANSVSIVLYEALRQAR